MRTTASPSKNPTCSPLDARTRAIVTSSHRERPSSAKDIVPHQHVAPPDEHLPVGLHARGIAHDDIRQPGPIDERREKRGMQQRSPHIRELLTRGDAERRKPVRPSSRDRVAEQRRPDAHVRIDRRNPRRRRRAQTRSRGSRPCRSNRPAPGPHRGSALARRAAAAASTTVRVASVEPPSTTTISATSAPHRASAASEAATRASSFSTGTITERLLGEGAGAVASGAPAAVASMRSAARMPATASRTTAASTRTIMDSSTTPRRDHATTLDRDGRPNRPTPIQGATAASKPQAQAAAAHRHRGTARYRSCGAAR